MAGLGGHGGADDSGGLPPPVPPSRDTRRSGGSRAVGALRRTHGRDGSGDRTVRLTRSGPGVPGPASLPPEYSRHKRSENVLESRGAMVRPGRGRRLAGIDRMRWVTFVGPCGWAFGEEKCRTCEECTDRSDWPGRRVCASPGGNAPLRGPSRPVEILGATSGSPGAGASPGGPRLAHRPGPLVPPVAPGGRLPWVDASLAAPYTAALTGALPPGAQVPCGGHGPPAARRPLGVRGALSCPGRGRAVDEAASRTSNVWAGRRPG